MELFSSAAVALNLEQSSVTHYLTAKILLLGDFTVNRCYEFLTTLSHLYFISQRGATDIDSPRR
jgi:hypothetical protein